MTSSDLFYSTLTASIQLFLTYNIYRLFVLDFIQHEYRSVARLLSRGNVTERMGR